LSDYIIAASASIDCEDNVNLQTELWLIKKLLNGLYYEDLEDLKIQWRDIEKLLGKLEESDQKWFYTQHIRDIKSIMSKLPKKLSEKK
jgi:orotate phosphoribosyltransferase-like protein